MNDRVVTAAQAEVRWGYQIAATCRACTVTRTDGAWAVVGTVVQADAFRIAQRPLVFVVTHRQGRWAWPIVSLQVAGASLTAALGPPEK